MTRRLLPLLLLLLASCATGADRARQLNALVGQSETDVVRQLGVPSRSYDTPGHRFLAYTQQSSEIVGGGPFLFGGGFYGGGYGYGPGFGYAGLFPAEVVPRVCETTFDVVDGRVSTWFLRGNACG